MSSEIRDLTSLRLPAGGDLRRQGAPDLRPDAAGPWVFDDRTLIYDVFSEGEDTVLLCPPLRNLWPVLRDGLSHQGQALPLRRIRRPRFEKIIIQQPGLSQLTFGYAGQEQTLRPGPSLVQHFAGLRCLVTVVKNEPPDWIVDWVKWHIAVHGSQALVLFDNGSTSLDLPALQQRLSGLEGLQRTLILRAPFPYGAPAGGRFKPPALFLQVALLNLARWRILARAASVLSVDVDEFVAPIAGSSVHQQAEGSRFGLVGFGGQWVYCPSHDGPASHREHSHRLGPDSAVKPGLQSPGKGRQGREGPIYNSPNPKWCLVPSGWANAFPWTVHRPGGPLFPLTRQRFSYWHFRSVSTGWNRPLGAMPKGARKDPALVAALSDVLG